MDITEPKNHSDLGLDTQVSGAGEGGVGWTGIEHRR